MGFYIIKVVNLMNDLENSFCIAIASHISNPKRINYLIDCLGSLLQQTVLISIYLSISFEDDATTQIFMRELELSNFKSNPFVHIVIQEKKTPQMRHFQVLYNMIKINHDWIMFCDDDDTYEPLRVEYLIKSIYTIKDQINDPNKILAGLYESHCNKDHREHRHEYWCYCVNGAILERFYDSLQDYPDIIDNKCCDVLFGEYMRRLGPKYFFGRLDMRLYNYRVTENQDSVTGVIQSRQRIYTKREDHPPIGDPDLPDYILDWNDYLYKNLDVYLHDVFLRTIVGCDLDYILKSEFLVDYDLLPYVDVCHVADIRERHEYWRTVVSKLYDIPL